MQKDMGQEKELNIAKAMIKALDDTGVLTFMYYPQIKTVTIPKRTRSLYNCKAVYENMPYSFAEDIVHEMDYSVVTELYHKIDRGERTASAIFHNKELNLCANVTITIVSWTEDGKPEKAVGYIENKSDYYNNEKLVQQLKEELAAHGRTDELDDALKTMAISIGSQYFAVYHIWLESHTYICFQEQLDGILSLIGEKGKYEPAWEKYINGYIDERDQASVREFVEITTLAERIGHKNTITITYRRKEIGWTRGQFIVGKRDENGMPLTVIYTVTDINEEVENKIQKQEAEEEVLRDPLTKLWNRKAFDQFKEQKDYKNNQTGILLFDIDRFKGINDQYGHETGDQVIAVVAQTVRDILRQKDLVFRMGGDEFAVLLYNCNASIWNTICRKIESIHTNIRAALSTDMHITISAGLCVSEAGYCDALYGLADRAMYNTKANGRGGCSFTDLAGNITKEWHDKSSYLRKGDVLEKNSTVTWRMEIPKNRDLPVRLHGDDLYMDFFGISKNASPEETYQLAVSRLEQEYQEIVGEAVIATIREGQAESIYLWNHPEKGKVQLRCSSSFDYEADDYYSIVGYIHLLKEDMHVYTLEDVNVKIQKALEHLVFCNFYVWLSDYSFKVYKAQSYMTELLANSENAIDAVNEYIKYMVSDESKAEMTEFLDMGTLPQRMKNTDVLDCNYNDPNIGWSKATFVAVDRNEKNEVETVILFVEAMS